MNSTLNNATSWAHIVLGDPTKRSVFERQAAIPRRHPALLPLKAHLFARKVMAEVTRLETTPLIHSRALTYIGHAYSPWAGSGRRKYDERKLADGQVELVCGAGLDDVHKAALGSANQFPWVALKSKQSRDARFVTCPECAKRIAAAGFVHAPKLTHRREGTEG